jgi:glycosyltransferase involved in cell wall biosynthesis
LHILFVTAAFPPFPGGAEKIAGALATRLAGQGCQVTVVTSSAKEEPDLWLGRGRLIEEEKPAANVRVIRCPIQPMPGGWRGLVAWRNGMAMLSALPGSQAGALMRMARRVPAIQSMDESFAGLKTPVNVVHGFNISWEQAPLAGWRFARGRNLPYVVTPFAHLGSRRVALKYVMDHQRKVMSDSDALLAMTSIEVDGLRRWGVSPRQVTVIGAGLDPLPPGIDSQEVMARYGLTQPFVLFIGRTSYDKGAIHAAQAILALRDQRVRVDLVLAGRISEEFERFYEQLPAQKRSFIRPLGVLDRSEQAALHALLEESSMLVLPSRMDSFGMVLLEAWAHGKPVIAADAGGIPGVVEDGEDGILVPFGDVNGLAKAVRMLLEDEALNRRLGESGREKVATRYNWDHVTARVFEVYETVLRR